MKRKRRRRGKAERGLSGRTCGYTSEPADAGGNRRARRVISYIRDSLRAKLIHDDDDLSSPSRLGFYPPHDSLAAGLVDRAAGVQTDFLADSKSARKFQTPPT